MPIKVTCPSCKAEFNVSEKFAGKQGPCPKCKTKITVPALPAGAAAAPPPEEVKIHAPESEAVAGKAAARGLVTKPITRQETTLKPATAAMIVIAVLAAMGGAWYAGKSGLLKGDETVALVLRGLALLVVSIPTAVAGYTFLRDDELEPYRGGSLWLRAAICALVYIGLWVGYYFIPPDFTTEVISWIFILPPFFAIGACAALFSFDLDFGNGFFHYSFYVLVTLGLGWLAGLAMPWAAAAATTAVGT
jgi:hypothetical protein